MKWRFTGTTYVILTRKGWRKATRVEKKAIETEKRKTDDGT